MLRSYEIRPQRVALIALLSSPCLHPPACSVRQLQRDESLRHVLPCMTTVTSVQRVFSVGLLQVSQASTDPRSLI